MIEKKLAELDLALPDAPAAAGSYVGFKTSGNLVVVSGQLPLKEGKPTLTGKLGETVTIDDAYAAAQQCALNVLAQLKLAVHDLMGRTVAQKMSASLGQTVVVENIPGANGIIGTRTLVNAPTDGRTSRERFRTNS